MPFQTALHGSAPDGLAASYRGKPSVWRELKGPGRGRGACQQRASGQGASYAGIRESVALSGLTGNSGFLVGGSASAAAVPMTLTNDKAMAAAAQLTAL